ncbi:MAG: ATP-binding protein [Muribaculaceae bacterium]|nr:ATP-binding protein [Muribaculaceae bacterium]
MEKDLKAIKGKFYIQRLIDEGEHEHQDFKYQISDARKIARSISAFANHDGGRLLIGVKDNGVVAGVRSDEDLYVIEGAAQMYCQPSVEVEMTAFRCDGGAVVYRVTIPRVENRPVFVREADKSLKAYYRVADENIVAHPLMIKGWMWRRAATGALLAYSVAERSLLHMLELEERVSPDDYMLRAHLSRQAADDAVVRLVSLDVVEFVHAGGRWVLQTRAAAQDESGF